MALLSMSGVTIAFGGHPLLEDADLAIERGERVCLLGRNGAGKSTALKLLDGTIQPDSGEIVRQAGVSVSRLSQEVPAGLDGSIHDVVAAGLGEVGQLLVRYHAASERVADGGGDAALRELGRLHAALDQAGTWEVHARVETVLQHLRLDGRMPFAAASGGRKRQVLLARALVSEPDVLLLDEPTNHLDVDAIEWMERHLLERGATLVFVTHDRAFLRRLATRVVELDRGRLVSWAGDYDDYLARKEAALAVEEREWADFDRRLAREEAWIRTGIQARRTRNEGRVRSLEAMRVERAARRERAGAMRARVVEGERSGRLVLETHGLGFAREGRPIVRDLTTTVMRGDRVGIMGPNGSGKTTLIRLMLGELPPDEGSVRLGTGLQIAYFDQMREQLDPDRSVFDSVADGMDFVEVGGERRHVNGYLQDFLFPPDRVRTPVRALSGGERNRLLLARLFTRSFNLLVLDEPTNDLDVETLELLEELLADFQGTLLLVSHDRAFLDAVVSSTLVMEGEGEGEGDGRVGEYAGGYSDWLLQRAPPAPDPGARASSERRPIPPARPQPPREGARRRITFTESHELAGLPDRIDVLERAREELYARLSDPAVLRDGAATTAATARLGELDAEIESLVGRWEELEMLAADA